MNVFPKLLLSLPLLWVGGVSADPANSLSWHDAVHRLQQGSDQLAGARAQVAQRQAQAEGIAQAGGPIVSVYGAAYSYKASLDLDLDPLKQGIGNAINLLPPAIAGMLPPLPPLPSNYTIERRNSSHTALVNAVWPIYLGGATDALRGVPQPKAPKRKPICSTTKKKRWPCWRSVTSKPRWRAAPPPCARPLPPAWPSMTPPWTRC